MKEVMLQYPYNVVEAIGLYDSKVWGIPYGSLTSEQEARMLNVIKQASIEDQELITKRFKEYKSYATIAKELEKGETTVRRLVSRAVLRMKNIENYEYIVNGERKQN